MRRFKKWTVAATAFILAVTMGGFVAQAQQSQQPVPDAYYQLLGQAKYAFGNAKSAADYAEAVKLFQQAANTAPWLPDTYYDLGKAQEKAKQFDDAINSLQRYLELKPDASDRDEVHADIEMLKGEAKQAAAQPAIEQQNQQQTQQQSDADFIASLNGARYSWEDPGGGDHEDLTIQGNQLIYDFYDITHSFHGHHVYQIGGSTAEVPNAVPHWICDNFGTSDCKGVYTIHPDYIEYGIYVRGTEVPSGTVIQGERVLYTNIYKRIQ